MSQTVKYILTVILIIAAAMWLITVYRSCENAKKNNTEITTDGSETEDGNTATIDTTDSAGLEDLYDEEEDESDSVSDNTTSEEEEVTSIDEDTSTDVQAEDDTFENRTGDYLVVAGAFVAKSNADSYQKQLIKKGYDAEVRIFLGSDYHSVILGDYATEREALVVVKKLGGEAYVHKRRPLKKKK